MPSKVALLNMALNWCRAGEIADPDGAGALQDACRRFYDVARDAVLAAYPWNEAAARAAVPASAGAPAFEWAYAYQLPHDCLKLRDLFDDPAALHVVESGRVLCNLKPPLRIRFTKRIEPEAMGALLFAAVAARLAADMAPSLMENASAAALLDQRYERMLIEARRIDAKEGFQPDPPETFLWLDARHGGAW